MAPTDDNTEIIKRLGRLEEKVAQLQMLIEASGATRTGEPRRAGEFYLSRGQAPSSQP